MKEFVCLIGHRGVGKSSLLKRLKLYFPDVDTFDLDQEISKGESKSINELFQSGEEHFRHLEEVYLEKIYKDHNKKTFVALGAGYSGKIPESKIIWIRRDSDSKGRVFLDRPRLNQRLSPLEEYKERFAAREKLYKTISHEVWTMPEGLFEASQYEKDFFDNSIKKIGGTLTLDSTFLQKETFPQWVSKWLGQGIKYFELRNDLLNEAELERALTYIPVQNRLVSLRPGGAWAFDSKAAALVDIDLGLILDRKLSANEFRSWHSSFNNIEDSLLHIKKNIGGSGFFKWAPEVNSLEELRKYDNALEKFPEIEFYPRSPANKTARWTWYRLKSFHRQKLGFFRLSSAENQDQASLAEILMLASDFKNFAAILGYPVDHSFSPAFHFEFFNKRQMPYFKIPLLKNELTYENLRFLSALGLRTASITSPLKESFGEEPVNSIVLNNAGVLTAKSNSDFSALVVLLKSLSAQDCVCWGAGAMSKIIKKILPGIECLSVREFNSQGSFVSRKVKCLIWAAGPDIEKFPGNIEPELIYDLSYQENSMAKQHALIKNCHYVSGVDLFRTQARFQQDFFSEHLPILV